ncbi:septal ring lytic transglycosylase RlpA family protein [Endothiovibrio diazotrophicus]
MGCPLRPLAAAALATALALTLAACGTTSRVGDLFEEEDGAPDRHIDVASIHDAVPRIEPRARYGNPESYEVYGKRYYVRKSAKGYKERGIASWYGTKFHGRKTSSGEPYDLYQMTAAHKTLPLPTYARVTHLKNGRSVIVKINDRGPFHDNRLIDLSYAAAVKLGIKATGTGFVEVEAIDPATWGRPSLAATPPSAPAAPVYTATAAGAAAEAASRAEAAPPQAAAAAVPARFYLQLGAFSSRGNAQRLADRLRAGGLGSPEISELRTAEGALYRVRIGPLHDPEEADRLATRASQLGVVGPRVVSD